jgi:hypothetical protein
VQEFGWGEFAARFPAVPTDSTLRAFISGKEILSKVVYRELAHPWLIKG